MRTCRLPAYTAVWRVVEIAHATEATVSTGDGTWETRPRLLTGRVDYRWTSAGAHALRDRRVHTTSGGLHVAGHVVQGGIVHWVPDDEWDHAVETTEWVRTQNIDDRAEHGSALTWGPRPGECQPGDDHRLLTHIEAARVLRVDPESVRKTLARNGIGERRGYPAAAVHTLAANRTGQGARTDLAPEGAGR